MYATPLEKNVREMVEPSLAAMGFALVLLRLKDGSPRVLELLAERADGSGVTLDDCAEISRTVSALLDVEDPIKGAYHLEVSSPGLDRPLLNAEDFARFAGHEAKVETILPVDGRKRFRGSIEAVKDGEVTLKVDGETFALPLEGVRSARLVITDALLKKKTAST